MGGNQSKNFLNVSSNLKTNKKTTSLSTKNKQYPNTNSNNNASNKKLFNTNNQGSKNIENFNISNGEEFKKNLNKEIGKIMNIMESSEKLHHKRITKLSNMNNSNSRILLNSNKSNKSISKNLSKSKIYNSNINNNNCSNNNNISNNLFYETNNFSGCNNENNFQGQSNISNNYNDNDNNSQIIDQNPYSSVISAGKGNKSKVPMIAHSIQKMEMEKEEYFNNLKKIKSNYEKYNTNKNKKGMNKKLDNKLEFVNPNKKIPNSYENIEENKELVRLLLKNPRDMTMEEKVYINSLDDKEFRRLIQYLKVKSRELQWRGNDLGSGHYNDLIIKIDRETERYLNVFNIPILIFNLIIKIKIKNK